MYISHYEHQTALVITLQGRLDAEGTILLEKYLHDLAPHTHRLTVFDLSGVGYINSTGLRALALVYKQCIAHDCELRLAQLTEPVARVVSMVGMDSVLSPYPSVQAALAN